MDIPVAIVEDDPEVRQWIAALVSHSLGLSCVAACASAEEALTQLPALQPDVVLMDIELPGISGIECLGRLRDLCPRTQVMMLTKFQHDEMIFRSLAAGATGYVLKSSPPAEIIEAITDLHRGGSPMSSQIARRVVLAFQKQPAVATSEAASLTDREREVLDCLARGLLYKEIADALGVTIHAIRTHIRNIYEKLHVHRRHEALVKIYGHDPAVGPRLAAPCAAARPK